MIVIYITNEVLALVSLRKCATGGWGRGLFEISGWEGKQIFGNEVRDR